LTYTVLPDTVFPRDTFRHIWRLPILQEQRRHMVCLLIACSGKRFQHFCPDCSNPDFPVCILHSRNRKFHDNDLGSSLSAIAEQEVIERSRARIFRDRKQSYASSWTASWTTLRQRRRNLRQSSTRTGPFWKMR
jgi:hypothetical protein